ncbi:tyrosine-type recombinase/integrase [Corynebacterium bovis]|uniref:tyrosine-type recombinase/integrase n=1 Tax=Corynebacterium bovis TaxID=36808 RepID=UPI003CC723E1
MAEQLAAHPRGREESVWGRSNGRMHERSSVAEVVRRTVAVNGLRPCTVHDLRRFYAAALIAGGAAVPEVQRVMGHADATTTLRVYAHLWPGRDDQLREVAGAAFSLVRDGCGMDGVRRGRNTGDQSRFRWSDT